MTWLLSLVRTAGMTKVLMVTLLNAVLTPHKEEANHSPFVVYGHTHRDRRMAAASAEMSARKGRSLGGYSAWSGDTGKDMGKDAGESRLVYDLSREDTAASAGSRSGKGSAGSSLRSRQHYPCTIALLH